MDEKPVSDMRPYRSCLNGGEFDLIVSDCVWPNCKCPREDSVPTATAIHEKPVSATPETDAILEEIWSEPKDDIHYVPPKMIGFARSLETRLREAEVARETLRGLHAAAEQDLDKMEERAERAEAAARIAELEAALATACTIAEQGFAIDYGFNYEASVEPRRKIAELREALERGPEVQAMLPKKPGKKP